MRIFTSDYNAETGEIKTSDRDMTPEEEATWQAEQAAVVEPVPREISRRQCAAQMFAMALISGPEALAMAATATPPAMVENMLLSMPEPQQTYTRIEFTAGTYERSNPLLNAFMNAVPGTTEAAIDQFFREAVTR